MANDFVIEGAKWGTTPGVLPGIPDVGTPGGIVKWAVDATVPASVQTLIGDAFSDWAQYANIQFQEVKTPADAQITFDFGHIDGPSDTLGVTNYFYGGGLLNSATIKLDNSESWDFAQPVKDDPSDFSIVPTLLHEIGHAIGLGHSHSPDTIMAALRNDAVTALTQSEVDGIQFLYGGPANGIGSGFNDTLTGDTASNKLQGLGGDDHISGGGGDDVLYGGAGADHLDGGAGTDTASYFTSNTGINVNLATGTASGGDAQGDVLTKSENLSGSQGNDTLTGNAGANVLQGWNGNDTLNGGAGKDTLTGGAGADKFVFGAIGDTVVGTNADRITDFSRAQGDKIDLSAIDANTGAAGNQAFAFIGTSLYSHHAGELRYAYNGNDSTIAGDINGDGTSDFHITLTGKIALLVADFVL